MKRIALATCILLSGCYVDPNSGYVYPAAQRYHQRQVLVYHYQVPPPNPYYRERHPEWQQPEGYAPSYGYGAQRSW